MFLKTFLFSFQSKIFLIKKSWRKQYQEKSKFYVINIIDHRIDLFKKKILTPHVMKTHIQKLCKEDKWKGRKCVRRLWIDPNNCLTDTQVHLFFIYFSWM